VIRAAACAGDDEARRCGLELVDQPGNDAVIGNKLARDRIGALASLVEHLGLVRLQHWRDIVVI